MAQLRAGAALINLVDVDRAGRRVGGLAGGGAQHGSSLHCAWPPRRGGAARAIWRATASRLSRNCVHAGARGESLSLYVRDPSGNVLELKGSALTCKPSRNWRWRGLSAIRLKHAVRADRNQERRGGAGRTLASLIGGAVEGVVREVIVCDRGSTDQTRQGRRACRLPLPRRRRHRGRHPPGQGRVAAAARARARAWSTAGSRTCVRTPRGTACRRGSRDRGSTARRSCRGCFPATGALADGPAHLQGAGAGAVASMPAMPRRCARGLATKRLACRRSALPPAADEVRLGRSGCRRRAADARPAAA